MAEVPDAIRRYFECVNSESWGEFRRLWHDDAMLEVVGGVRLSGLDEILPYYPRVLASFPVHHDDPHGIHVAGDIVTVEITFRGETREGVRAEWGALDVFTLEDGRIRRLVTWYDLGEVVELLRTPGLPERRLRNLVRHAATASPFYRRRFQELELEPERVAEDLSLLTPTRADSAFGPDELLAVPHAAIRQVLSARQPVPLTRDDVDDLTRLWSRALELAGVTRDDTLQALEPYPGLEAAAGRGRVRLVPASSAAVEPRGQARAAAAVATTVLVASPDHLLAFRAATAALGVELPALRLVLLCAESSRPPLEETGTPILEVFGPAETGIAASGCGRGEGLHAYTDAHVIELVAPGGVAPGGHDEPGELLVTPLGRTAMPLLRFDTGVLATWVEGRCACGSDLPRIELERQR